MRQKEPERKGKARKGKGEGRERKGKEVRGRYDEYYPLFLILYNASVLLFCVVLLSFEIVVEPAIGVVVADVVVDVVGVFFLCCDRNPYGVVCVCTCV